MHHTPEERTRLKALREELQRERPTPEDLLASGDCSEPVPHGVVLNALRLLARDSDREAVAVYLDRLADQAGQAAA